MKTMISIKNLNYQKNGKIILKDISVSIQEGDFVAILGPNGAGKTTLLKIILGLISDYSGTVEIDNLSSHKWLRNNIIGYLPQGEKFDTDFPATALDITLMGYAGIKGLFKSFNKEDKNKAKLCLEQVGLLDKSNQYISTLSGGEFQRVLLARALISGSRYLFLDEPEANLDREGVRGFFQLLKEINSEGRTIVVISHDINILTEHCNMLICLNKTLHCHSKTELMSGEMLQAFFGDTMKVIDKEY